MDPREIITALAGFALIAFVGVDVVQAGGVDWGSWTVAGYAVLAGIGLTLLHPKAGRWLMERGPDLLPWGGDDE